RFRVLDEHRLPYEEVAKVDRHLDVRIGALLERKFYVAADGAATTLHRAAVSRLHDPGSAAGNDREPGLSHDTRRLPRRRVLRIIHGNAGRPEDGDRATSWREGVEALDELTHDAEDTPGIGSGEVYGRLGLE